MRGRLKAMLDGAGWSVGLAAALFAFALLFVLLDLQAPEMSSGRAIMWSPPSSTASRRSGGKARPTRSTCLDSGRPRLDIYFNPGDPSAAMADNVPDRLFAGLFVGVPVLAGVGVLLVGLTRKRRWDRRRGRTAASYGTAWTRTSSTGS